MDIDSELRQDHAFIEEKINQAPEGDRAELLTIMSQAPLQRYTETGSVDFVNRALVMNERRMAMTPETHPEFRPRLSNLGNAFLSRLGSINDLDRAIDIAKQVVEVTSRDDPSYALYLGTVLKVRFDKTGSMNDLEDSIKANEEAVALTRITIAILQFISTFWEMRCTGNITKRGQCVISIEQLQHTVTQFPQFIPINSISLRC